MVEVSPGVPLAGIAAIAGMGLVTYGTRALGFWLVNRITLGARLKAALEAMPGAILMAVIAPIVLATGPAESLAALATLLVARKAPIIVAIACGVASVALLRHWMS
jgi:branched chain amino acid efflux pump